MPSTNEFCELCDVECATLEDRVAAFDGNICENCRLKKQAEEDEAHAVAVEEVMLNED